MTCNQKTSRWQQDDTTAFGTKYSSIWKYSKSVQLFAVHLKVIARNIMK